MAPPPGLIDSGKAPPPGLIDSGEVVKLQTDMPHLVSLGSGRLSVAVTLLPLREGNTLTHTVIHTHTLSPQSYTHTLSKLLHTLTLSSTYALSYTQM